jgi:16S rRNA G966 N2-methylase RsmD
MEQCSSSQTADYKASLVKGESFADFSGGFGVDTAAFAKKFKKGYYVEPQEELCELFQQNCKALVINNVNILNGPMEEHLGDIGRVDLIYLDPSRRDTHGRRVISLADCTPNLLEWKSDLLSRCNTLMVKMSPMIDIFQTLRDLPETYAVHAVAVEGECKEVVFLLKTGDEMVNDTRRDAPWHVSTTDPTIIAVDINNKSTPTDIRRDALQHVSTTLETERTTPPCIATALGTYLYEPNAAVMKAGIFNALSQQYQVAKLAKSTNLFTANDLREDFPGRVFRILVDFS